MSVRSDIRERKNARIIVVLGMHRSGTSAITRALRIMGVELGNQFLPIMEEVNAKGFWEDLDINALNVEILEVLKSNWYFLAQIEPNDVEYLRKEGYFLRAEQLLRDKVCNESIFGFKDPRVAKLLPFWKEVFDHCQFDVSYIITLRHPLSVAKSLAIRDGFEAEHSYLLWLGHIINSLQGSADSKRVIVDYDRLMLSPDYEIKRIAKHLDLRINATELEIYKSNFIDLTLRHSIYDLNDLELDDTCLPLVKEIFLDLLDVTIDKINIDDSSLQRKCISWMHEFERMKSTLVFSDKILLQKKIDNISIAERDEQISVINESLSKRNEELNILNQLILERDKTIGDFNHAVLIRDEQIAVINESLSKRYEELTILNQLIFERDKTIDEYNHAVLIRDEQISVLNVSLGKRDKQLKELNQALAQCDEEINKYQQVVKSLEVECAKFNQAISEQNSTINQLLSSASWRITAPLRKLRFVISRIDKYMRRPNPRTFNASWYLGQNPDVAISGMNPYEHYISYGKKEGRLPKPPVFWLRNILDKVVLFTRNSFIRVMRFFFHYIPLSLAFKSRVRDYFFIRIPFLFHGVGSYELMKLRNLASAPHSFANPKNELDWNLMLPANAKSISEIVSFDEVDVIIPVYRGVEQTKRCIESVVNSREKMKTQFRLIVINDASPENQVTAYLQSLPSSEKLIVIVNQENMGFTATVNKGMGWSDKNDVVLLNSDAEVANDWLDKLTAQAYSIPKVASVTPFSNNATICSYPSLSGIKELPIGESVASMDAAFASANMKRNIEIPTAIGFCMYIRRDCLNEVGLFDVETFGKGYGEENDFCLRATAKGWKHLLAADTFVFHEGEVSFQSGSNPRKERAMNIIRERYPKYESDVAKHVGKDEAYVLRVAATAARFKQAVVPVVLHILHAVGGGTNKHVEELMLRQRDNAMFLVMSPSSTEQKKVVLQVISPNQAYKLDIHFPTSNFNTLVSFIQSFGISLVHIHHLLGYAIDIRRLIDALHVPFYFTIHDAMLICPRIHLISPSKMMYCGEPDVSECNKCLSIDLPQGESNIISWRKKHSWYVNNASVVISPSYDTAMRSRKYFPDAVYRIVPHDFARVGSVVDILVPELNKKESMRIAILGAIGPHKGSNLIEGVLKEIRNNKLPLQIKLFGWSDLNLAVTFDKVIFSQTGPYTDAELLDKINEYDPHLILFTSRCPETYSYTLSAAIKCNRPIVAPNLGAFTERLVLRPWSWIFDWDISSTQLIEKLCEIRVKNILTRIKPMAHENNEIERSDFIEDINFYEKGYLDDIHSFSNTKNNNS